MKRVANIRNWPNVPAFTIVEAAISMVIVAVMLVAALNTVGASRLTQHRAAMVSRGGLFAEMLLSEILRQSYKEPDGATDLGRDLGELATTRVDYDDVDDYHGWSATPPTAQDGTPLTNSTGWTQEVVVRWVDPSQPDQVVGAESGAKRIVVTISYNGVPQASIAALRTAHE